jgi:hypothetical protein
MLTKLYPKPCQVSAHGSSTETVVRYQYNGWTGPPLAPPTTPGTPDHVSTVHAHVYQQVEGERRGDTAAVAAK